MTRLNQKGTVLLYAVIAMTAISVLGTGIYFLTSTSTFGGLRANQQNRAYQLALAGKDYALTKNLGNTATQYPAGRDFTFKNSVGGFTNPVGDKFRLVINDDTITSTGIVNENTPYEARRTITVTKTEFSKQADISFTKDILSSFSAPAQSQSGFITPVPGADQISLGKTTMPDTFGALWYQGAAPSGNCTGGRCEFGTGFRAFFVFQFGAGSTGNGFTFALKNGNPATNDVYSVGGGAGMGELLGYAGDSRTATGYLDGSTRAAAGYPGILGHEVGRGIQPPKIAIEFDPRTNRDLDDVCFPDSRRDGNEGPDRNHAGYVFWGDNTNSTCDSTVGRNTYDDNRHNAGTDSSSDPRNSRRPSDGADPSYYNGSATWPYNWLLSNSPNIYAVRVEVTRRTKANGDGEYIIKSWLKQCKVDIACTITSDDASSDDASSFANTKFDYTGGAATLTRTTPITLTPELHNKFDTFFFGWTTATGVSTQNILINRFKINFRN